jgi:hypothetical protein
MARGKASGYWVRMLRQKSRTTNRAYILLRSFGRYDLMRQSGLAHKADRSNESHRANVRESHAEL